MAHVPSGHFKITTPRSWNKAKVSNQQDSTEVALTRPLVWSAGSLTIKVEPVSAIKKTPCCQCCPVSFSTVKGHGSRTNPSATLHMNPLTLQPISNHIRECNGSSKLKNQISQVKLTSTTETSKVPLLHQFSTPTRSNVIVA